MMQVSQAQHTRGDSLQAGRMGVCWTLLLLQQEGQPAGFTEGNCSFHLSLSTLDASLPH